MIQPRANQGDVVLVLFPHSDLRTAKLRPAVVIQSDDLDVGLPQTIVAMITSNLSRLGPPSRLNVSLTSDIGRDSGLLTDSVVMTDNVATIRYGEIGRIIGRLPKDDISRCMRHTFAL